MDPIERLRFDAAALMADHPPRWDDANKQVAFDIACRPGDAHAGTLGYSRWAPMRLPVDADLTTIGNLVLARDGYFDYEPFLDGAHVVEWHVNFADPHLFVAYGSSLFAQDEMQVAEHPVLGALREALDAGGHPAVTVDHGEPTPVLVTGVERRCRVATNPDPTEGRPYGLYGNAFARASADAVARATVRIVPPTITNLIAMAAPAGGYGRYRTDQIESILLTAFTGFRAATLESRRLRGVDARVAVHTGYWGCGAFGGNRVLMVLLQVVAARLAGVDRIVIHTGGPEGRAPLAEALRSLGDDLLVDGGSTTDELIARVEAMAFTWGVSDGN